VAEFERFYVTRLIEANYGNLTLAARIARMDRKYLNELMKKHHLEDVRKNAARSNANFRE